MKQIRGVTRALRPDLLAAAGLLGLILIFLWPGYLPGRVLLPLDIVVEFFPPWQEPNRPVAVRNLILGDAVTYIYPVKEFAAAAVRRGEVPLWNPYLLGGYPFTYNTQAGVYYPLSLLYYLLPAATAVNLTIIVQMLLGALFMYTYLRLLSLRQVAALVLEPAGAWLPLAPGSSLARPFAMPDAGLHRVDLWLRAGAEASGSVITRLQTADGVLELGHATVAVAGELDDELQPFYFGAFPSEWGREFRLVVEFEGEGELAVATTGDATASAAVSGNRERLAPLAFAAYYLPRPDLVHEAGKTRVYRRPGYFPRAFAVHQATVAAGEEDALAALLAHQHELDRLVVLAADMAAAGYVVLADVYYPGWQATVNGQRTAVYRANSILRAVYVPAGQHTMVFSFRPPDFLFGAFVSLLTLVSCLIFIGHGGRRPKK
jgi:hypothetical protein